MTTLWFRHLRAEDRVSATPQAAPVLLAVNYLLGSSTPPTWSGREFGGLQGYPAA